MLLIKTDVVISKLYLFITVYISILLCCNAGDNADHQNFILSGVTSVLRTSIPATISLLNEQAFPILAGNAAGFLRPHVAGAEYGSGRIVAYSHSSFYLRDNLPAGNENTKLFMNSVNWVRKNENLKVGAYVEKETENVLRDNGFDVQFISGTDFYNLTHLEQFDFLVTKYVDVNIDGELALGTYIRNGGGLVIAVTAWNKYNYTNPESYWANVALQDTGLFCIGEHYTYATIGDSEKGSFNASLECLRDTHAVHVWNDLKESITNQTYLPSERFNHMATILDDRFKFGAINHTLGYDLNQKLLGLPTFVPTEKAPVTEDNQKYFILVHYYLSLFLNYCGFTSNIPAHPSAESFPGVPSGKLERISHRIDIDVNLPSWTNDVTLEELKKMLPSETIVFHEANGNVVLDQNRETIEFSATKTNWHSTGLYALPGEEIEIQLLNADVTFADIEVQIGTHKDDIQKKESWSRCPIITYQNKLKYNGNSTITNPFGGPIYIGTSMYRNISLQLLIGGGIRSPTYFLGETVLPQWRNEIRNNPAPWGELVGKNMVVIAQKSIISQLDNPEEVIDLWDRIMDAMADLRSISRERVRAERLVADVQIGGGWMHSGYPIMYYLSVQGRPVNVTAMRKELWNMWGFLHELGHNHQKSDWTFAGTGEVTCNLFALYVMHVVLYAPTNMTHSDLSDAKVALALRKYTENGKPFSQWKDEPFLALHTYIQLQETFGWSAYQRVFANYQHLTADERPKNDQEKMDLWMIMFSRVVGENLAPFFISWGFPITAAAQASVSYLPSTELRIPQPT